MNDRREDIEFLKALAEAHDFVLTDAAAEHIATRRDPLGREIGKQLMHVLSFASFYGVRRIDADYAEKELAKPYHSDYPSDEPSRPEVWALQRDGRIAVGVYFPSGTGLGATVRVFIDNTIERSELVAGSTTTVIERLFEIEDEFRRDSWKPCTSRDVKRHGGGS
jgi:hypothetical protein